MWPEGSSLPTPELAKQRITVTDDGIIGTNVWNFTTLILLTRTWNYMLVIPAWQKMRVSFIHATVSISSLECSKSLSGVVQAGYTGGDSNI